MLTTEELKKLVETIVAEKIQPHFEEKFNIRIHFTSATDYDWEGTYIFTEDELYHCNGVERGRVQNERTTTSLDEITYWALTDVIFPLSMRYATQRQKEGENFRRAMFRFELEAFGYAGEVYRAMLQARIDWALEQAPFND